MNVVHSSVRRRDAVNLNNLILVLLTCSACFTPEDRFDDFIAAKQRLASDAGTDAGEQPGNTQPLKADQVTGSYLYAVSTPVNPAQPTVYLAEVEASQQGDGLEVRIRQRPLAVVDRTTPVGDFSEWTTSLVDPSGAYETPPLTTIVPAAANSFGLPLTTTVAFKGAFKNPATAELPDTKVDFFCGTATGMVQGLNLSLEGSTFAAARIPDVANTDTYPDVVINCNKDPAAPL